MQEFQIVDATDLARAYAAADYAVELDGRTVALRVGEFATELESSLTARRYAFITAWNPASSPRAGRENEVADGQLRERLDGHGAKRIPAWAQAPDGRWREQGWMVLDLPAGDLDTLARDFGQAGTLQWARGEPVCLRMMMAAPMQAAEMPCVDWVE
ncbi:DUF3293 domain-containing protein [Lysobacter korlensis]